MGCKTTFVARRNGDFRETFSPMGDDFTFANLQPEMSIRRGMTQLLLVSGIATPNGSSFIVADNSVVVTIKQADLLLLDSTNSDLDSDDMFYDVVMVDDTGFRNWVMGGDFILAGMNDPNSCQSSCGPVEITLNGQCVIINIDGGNLGPASAISLQDLNQAVVDAQEAADEAEEALSQINSGLISKANTNASNVSPFAGVWRDAISAPEHRPFASFIEVRVPSQYPTLQDAYESCESYFGPFSVFQIRLDDGIHDIATVGTLAIDKNIGVDLRFVGNAANPSGCVLKTDQPGKVLVSATARGAGVYINGITFEHTDINNRLDTMAILADDGGFIHMGPAAHTKGFFWNLFARRGGIIRSDGGSHIDGGDTNALAYIGGVISVVGCTLTGANDLLSTLGSGAVCEGGSMDISFANLSGNKRAGLHCIEGYVRAMDTQFNNNTNNGVAQDGGHVDLTTGCTASNNGAYGYRHDAGEAGGLQGLTGTGNGQELIKPLRKLEDGASLDRNYALVRAPAGGRWHDNVLGIQNQSVHPANFRGNAAINFLDSAGTEKGAMGFSRNAALAPNDGYIADTVYVEFGNPFDTANPSHFRLILTMKAGSPHWGGAYTAYDVIHVDPTNGNVTFSGNGLGVVRFKDEVIFGQDGIPKIVTHTLASVKARVRERGFLNQYCVATNVQNMSAPLGDPVAKDNDAVPSWSVGFGGSDTFVVHRAPAGTGQVMSNVYEVHPNGMLTTAASGNPEGVVVGPVGALFPSSNGTLYFKATGTGNTGWKAVSLV